jgi:hypothetical protein
MRSKAVKQKLGGLWMAFEGLSFTAGARKIADG